jgi:flagellar biosynthesis/type III secretory pathway protein FliH
MSGIVKASRVSLSRAVLRIAGNEPAGVQSELPERNDPTLALQARIEVLEEQLRAQREQGRRQERAAYEKGLREGTEKTTLELTQQWDRQADAIARAARAAQDSFDTRLAALETLALDLAEAALGRVLGDTARHAGLLAQTIAHHLRGLERNVVRVAVSGRDFPDEGALEELASLPDALRRSIEVRENLPAGACHVDLALGHADLSLPSQHERLSRMFAALKTHD